MNMSIYIHIHMYIVLVNANYAYSTHAVFKHGNSMAYQIPRKTQKWWVGFGKTFAGSPVLVKRCTL